MSIERLAQGLATHLVLSRPLVCVDLEATGVWPGLTLMDKLMVASFILIALTALENMFAVLLTESHPDIARRLDLTSRWFFPLAYVIVIIAVSNLSA